MKRNMKKLLLFALICIFSAAAVFTVLADTTEAGGVTGVTEVTGDGSWYYVIDTGEASSDDSEEELEFWVEMYDENGDWFTTTSIATYWAWDEDGSLTYDSIAENWWGEDHYSVTVGTKVAVTIAREDGDIAVTYYAGGAEVYTANIYGASFTDTVTWQVNVQKGSVTVNGLFEKDQYKITDVSVKSYSATEYTVGSCFDPSGTVLSITYKDGHTEEVTLIGATDLWDAYGNVIGSYTELQDDIGDGWGDYTYVYNADIFEDDGKYSFIIMASDFDYYGYGADYTEYTFADAIVVREANIADASSSITLTMDGKYDASSEEQWFVYTPSETGYYTLQMEGEDETETYISLYKETEGGILSLCKYGWLYTIGTSFYCELKEGATYYFRIGDCAGSFSPYEVKLTEGKAAVAIEVESLEGAEQVQYDDELDLSGTVLKVTYSDGSTESVVMSEETWDAYGNYYDYYLKIYDVTEEEGFYYIGSYPFYTGIDLATGSHELSFRGFYSGYREGGQEFYYYDTEMNEPDCMDESQSIEVVSLQDSSKTIIEIAANVLTCTAEVNSTDGQWFSFTPSEDAAYCFIDSWNEEEVVDAEEYSVYGYITLPAIYRANVEPEYSDTYLDENENVAYYDEDTEESYWMYWLEEGKTYYFKANLDITDETGGDVDASVPLTITVLNLTGTSVPEQTSEETTSEEDPDMTAPSGDDQEATDDANSADGEAGSGLPVWGYCVIVVVVAAAAVVIVLVVKKKKVHR